MRLERTVERWRGMDPAAVAQGSQAQVLHALADARRDILALAAEVDALRAGAVRGVGMSDKSASEAALSRLTEALDRRYQHA